MRRPSACTHQPLRPQHYWLPVAAHLNPSLLPLGSKAVVLGMPDRRNWGSEGKSTFCAAPHKPPLTLNELVRTLQPCKSQLWRPVPRAARVLWASGYTCFQSSRKHHKAQDGGCLALEEQVNLNLRDLPSERRGWGSHG